MKKILQFIILFSFPLILNAQLTGDGSWANPWSGTLTGDASWSGTKFINGDITIDNEKLTITPGAIIIFLSESADLIITGTGQLEADGTAESMIRFSADDDNDGNYGESGERWGHISFQSMGSAGASLIDYCIIEYGDVRTAGTVDNPYRYGGAIHAAFTDLTVSNSILQNNKAKWGGALFVNKNFAPAIRNCYILNNTSDRAGGGFYFWDGSSSLVENCIFEGNACLETTNNNYSGGGLCAQTGTSIKVVNCTFVNNTTSRPNGAGVEFYGSNNARLINTILWGSNNQLLLSGTVGSTIINSAIQASVPSGSINCKILNPSNSDPSGPNFTNLGSDWSIKYISPCRDAGTNSFGSPNIIPEKDYLGNNRVITTDIGAYEVQYSRWKTDAATTDWNTGTNWDGGVPAANRDVIVPSGASLYPTSAPGPDFTIGAGKLMIVEPGARVTVNSLTNNGSLKLNANASALSSLILNSYNKGAGASEEIQLRITGGYVGDPELNQGKWHYISSPVQYFPVDPTFTTTTFNLAQWVDGIQAAQSIREGWVAYDGYIYITGGFNPAYEFSELTPGKGYNLLYINDTTYTLSGNFNSANVPVLLSFAGDAYSNGYNLLGNPFPSGLDWDYIVENPNYPYPQNTSQGIIFTKDDELYYYTGGVLVPDISVPGTSPGVIPPMQGFFVKTYSTGNTINLTPDARTHDGIPPRYKGKAEVPLLRLAISENNITDETVVRFAENAKPGIDYAYDAVKMINSTQKTAIYTSYGTYNFAINGQPFPDAETIAEIPLTVNLITDGNHTISLKQLQALDKYDLSLIDKTTGFSVDLSTTSSLAFSSSKGLIKDRFVIKISNISTGVEDPEKGKSRFNIYSGFGLINIQTLADEWDGRTGSVKVMDMSGKTVSDLRRTEFSKTSVTQIKAPDANGLYFIEIKSGVNRFVGKVLIK